MRPARPSIVKRLLWGPGPDGAVRRRGADACFARVRVDPSELLYGIGFVDDLTDLGEVARRLVGPPGE